MKFSLINARGRDSERWAEYALRSPTVDVHFGPGYARTQEELGGVAWLAVVDFENGGFVAQPFIARAVPFRDTGYSDLASFYGYGGPFSNCTDRQQLVGMGIHFEAQLRRWAFEASIVAEYCCLHPFAAQQQSDILFHCDVKPTKEVVSIDLTQLSEANFARRVRRGLNIAKASGVTIWRGKPEEHIALFDALYTLSMQAKNAERRWYFPRRYFAAHFENMDGGLFFANVDGVVCRALMVIGSGATAYAHFLGSTGAHRDRGVDETLYYEAAQSLRDVGYKKFHLGGGRTSDPNDSLLLFKSGFSSLRFPVARYERIYQPSAYSLLVEKKRREEVVENGVESTANFFPLYRRGIA